MANTPAPFQFPNFNMAGFPYANLPQQIASAYQNPAQQFSNGSQYGRWNGINNNAFGLFPNQFGALFGYQPQGGGMAFQPPWGNNGMLGSNQGPGANPGGAQAASPNVTAQSAGAQNPYGLGATQYTSQYGTTQINGQPVALGADGQPDLNATRNMYMTGGFNPNAQMTADPNSPLAKMSASLGQSLPSGIMPSLNSGAMPKIGGGDVNYPQSNVAPVSGGNGVTFSGGNFQAPSIPNVPGSNQQFSSNFMPTGANTQSAELQHALASGRLQGSYAQNLSQMPQSFTPGQFNQVAQQNPVLAEQMAAQGGQPYMNAIMGQNGWSPQQMNNFINAYGSSATPGFGPSQLNLLRSLGIG